ncbi:MAG: hypothetical protein RBQ66_09025 [Candidatus Cloacimonadaceae bacterium]|jgi:hypothetical protein|nr:hypothetical protein [Candidatus Cloacimonadaceae bacterium]
MLCNYINFYQPLNSANEWQYLLKDPSEHWKDGKSAKELAKYWANRQETPSELKHLLQNEDISLVFLFPEYQVPMPAIGGDSHNDLYVLATSKNGLIVIMIESKAGESFDKIISEWYLQKERCNKDEGLNASSRLNSILQELGLGRYAKAPYKELGDYRYQLFHRTLSALREAKRVNANRAIVLIQSFENDPVSQADFFKYVRLFVAQEKMTSGSLIGPVRINGIDLSFAWLDCEKSNLVID